MEVGNKIMNVAILRCPQHLVELTKGFEGLRLKPYKCPAGKLTIGYGRNLTDLGISESEADILFHHDFLSAELDTIAWLKKYDMKPEDLSENRFYVLTDMMFNMGWASCLQFKTFMSELKKGHYDDAAKAMLKSKWATQVGNRAIKLAGMMKNG